MKPLTMKSIEQLYYSEIHSVPRSVDWTELAGENGEGFECYEAADCPSCGKTVAGLSNGEEQHRDGVPGSKCNGYINREGPMMNSFYPCEWRGEPEEEAAKIADLPLCIIQSDLLGKGLALTGGGMDLQHEIIEAYVRLGFYPPVHFSLPVMAGRGTEKSDLVLVAACKLSATAVIEQTQRQLDRLDEYVAQSKEYAKRRAS